MIQHHVTRILMLKLSKFKTWNRYSVNRSIMQIIYFFSLVVLHLRFHLFQWASILPKSKHKIILSVIPNLFHVWTFKDSILQYIIWKVKRRSLQLLLGLEKIRCDFLCPIVQSSSSSKRKHESKCDTWGGTATSNVINLKLLDIMKQGHQRRELSHIDTTYWVLWPP